MRLRIFVAAASSTVAGTVGAAEVTPIELARTPSAFVGEEVVLRRVACVDQGSRGSLICVAKAGGKLLIVDAVILGDRTDLDLNQRIADECQGTANLDSHACVFDATFTPTSAQREDASPDGGDLPAVRIYARTLDLAAPGKAN